MKVSINDEKDLTIVAVISAIFIVVTLSQNVGVIFALMAIAYAITISQNRGVMQFSRSGLGTKTVLYAFGVIGGFIAFASFVLGSPQAVIQSVTTFASSFLVNFTINNPLIKLVVWGFFIPVVETLFFFGVIFPFVLRKTQATSSLNDQNTLISIAMVAGIATAFHFVVRLLNDQSLLIDLVFWSVSGIVIILQKEMSGAAAGHIGLNTAVMLKILGFIH